MLLRVLLTSTVFCPSTRRSSGAVVLATFGGIVFDGGSEGLFLLEGHFAAGTYPEP